MNITAIAKGLVISNEYYWHFPRAGYQWWLLLPLRRDWISMMNITANAKGLIINETITGIVQGLVINKYHCHC